MKKLNNKGFSLVELVIATAILSVVAVTVGMMMTSGTNMYSGVQKKANMLFKSQVSTAQLENIIVNVGSDDGLAIDGNTMYIVSTGEKKLTKLEIDSLNNRLVLKEYKITPSESSGDPATCASVPETDVPFSYNIENIRYNVTSDAIEGVVRATAMNFTLTVVKDSMTYEKNILISLKNKPMFEEGADAVNTLLSSLRFS
jgi:prepilin-type N-terminal cleavage/methylation domain-containing protein